MARHAQRDIDRILWTSADRHGPRAADRYRRLIARSLTDLRHDPARPSSRSAAFADLRLYALRVAARSLAPADKVRAAVHVVVYRFDDRQVEIVRVLHEAMDLPRWLEQAAAECGED
ncbi:MAG: type II toxin-antitoxin system RelE/ParE family toxin [Caulobacter sp.]|nr:type II toxin-antitoxin system RelE/ParE family toxin [Caulobacter sp.]